MLEDFNESYQKNIKIGFDAKRLYHNRTGLGNYSRDLLRILKTYYPKNKYVLFNPKYKEDTFFNESNGFQQVNPSGFLKKIHAIWRTFFLKSNPVLKTLDIYHGLSAEIPVGLSKEIKKIVTIHDLIFIRYPNLYSFWDRKIHILKHKYAIKNSDLIIAISEQTKNDIITYFDVNPEKIKVIYQGCAAIFKENNIDEEQYLQIKNKYNLPDKFILNVGTIEERKNALSIVKAIKDLDVHLIIIGKRTPYTSIIEKYIIDSSLQNKVSILEGVTLEELAIFYKKAELFIYPSVFEGFGIPIIESLYSGTPVITNKDGVFKEAGGKGTCYIDVNNTEEMKENIIKILEDKTIREKMISTGTEYVQQFNDENLAFEWNKVYSKCLQVVQSNKNH